MITLRFSLSYLNTSFHVCACLCPLHSCGLKIWLFMVLFQLLLLYKGSDLGGLMKCSVKWWKIGIIFYDQSRFNLQLCPWLSAVFLYLHSQNNWIHRISFRFIGVARGKFTCMPSKFIRYFWKEFWKPCINWILVHNYYASLCVGFTYKDTIIPEN